MRFKDFSQLAQLLFAGVINQLLSALPMFSSSPQKLDLIASRLLGAVPRNFEET